MDFIHILVLALLQGFTEFLPISSSAHLIIFPKLLHWPDQGLAFDLAVHVGTLSAVIYYFRGELIQMLRSPTAVSLQAGGMLMRGNFSGLGDLLRSLRQGPISRETFLLFGVIIGTIPVGLFGLAIKDFVEKQMRSDAGPLIIATTTIVFGLLLWWADRQPKQERNEHQITFKDILVIGCAQALALIPGTSRSGITITAGIMMGLTRSAAARFSFLLSIPAILLPGMLKTKELIESQIVVYWGDLLLGILLSAMSAYVCIHLFLSMLQRMSMFPFVVYRIILGVFLFIVFSGNFAAVFSSP